MDPTVANRCTSNRCQPPSPSPPNQLQAATDQMFLRGHRRFAQHLAAELRELRDGAQGFAAQAVAVHRHQQAVPGEKKHRFFQRKREEMGKWAEDGKDMGVENQSRL